MLVPMRQLARETDMISAAEAYCSKVGASDHESVLSAEELAISIRKYIESKTEDKTIAANMLGVGSKTSLADMKRMTSKKTINRFLYVVDSSDGKKDMEFVSSKTLFARVADGLFEENAIDLDHAYLPEIARACEMHDGTPLLLTPIAQARDFVVWIPESSSEQDIAEYRAQAFACIMQSVAMFGESIDVSERAKQAVIQAISKSVAKIGVIHSNADELVAMTAQRENGDDLEISEIRDKIFRYNARINIYKQISHEAGM